MAALRRKTPAFVYGDYQDLDPTNPKIFAFTRGIGADKYLVVLNFSTDAVTYTLPDTIKAGDLVISPVVASTRIRSFASDGLSPYNTCQMSWF